MFNTKVWVSNIEVTWLLNNSALVGAVQASDGCGVNVGGETGKHLPFLPLSPSIFSREGCQKMYHVGSGYYPCRTRARVLGMPSRAGVDLAISASFVPEFWKSDSLPGCESLRSSIPMVGYQ